MQDPHFYAPHWTPQPPPQQQAPGPSALFRKDRRFWVGLSLLVAGLIVGALLLVVGVIAPALETSHSRRILGIATLAACLPVGVYLFVPWIVDRYDPEPWWALLGVFLWGALFATGVSGVINSIVGHLFGRFAMLAVSAPLVEELTKGMAIWGMVMFLRRDFDGVVDGIIYATFVAIGFAAIENILYYLRGGLAGEMGRVVVIRGVMTPWCHPLFTAMTGIGFGAAREHGATWSKVLFPVLGYCAAVALHALWNGLPYLFGGGAFIVNLIVGLLFAVTFFFVVVYLVYRKGKTIRRFLEDEVLIGTMSQDECDLVCSPFGRMRALLSWRGRAGRRFVQIGARLALSKWHAARAMKSQKHTISADFVVPLRQELARLRLQMQR